LCNRAVLAIEGGAPGDLEFRFTINRELRRSIPKEKSNFISLRRSQKANVAFDNTVNVTVDEVNQAEDSLIQAKSALEGEMTSLQASSKEVAEAEDDGTLPANLPLGWKITKKGKIIQNLAEIQQAEMIKKRMDELVGKVAAVDKDLILIGRMRQAAESTVAVRLEAAWKTFHLENPDKGRSEFGLSDHFRTASQAIALPRLTSPVTGVAIETFLNRFPPEGYEDRLLKFLDRHPSDPFWHAPPEAVVDGKVQPLAQSAQSWLMKNQSNKTLKLSALDKLAKERMAWRWLIISHNQVNPTSRVKLPPQLSVNYERKGRHTMVAKRPDPPTDELIRSVLAEFKKTVNTASAPQSKDDSGSPLQEDSPAITDTSNAIDKAKVDLFVEQTFQTLASLMHGFAEYDEQSFEFKSCPGISKTVARSLNSWCVSADSLLHNKEPPAIDPPAAGALHSRLVELSCVGCGQVFEVDEEWLGQAESAGLPFTCDSCAETSRSDGPSGQSGPLDSFEDEEGRMWIQEDLDPFPFKEGEVLLKMEKDGISYLAKQVTKPKPDPKGKGKAKEGVQLPSKPAVPTPPSKPPGNPVKTGEKAETKGGQPGKASPLTEENPLRVKAEPASRALSDDQRKSLRKFFKLTEGLVPPLEWSQMDSKQRARALKERSIPRWATAAVLRRPENLELILKGTLTKDTVGEVLAATPSGSKPYATGQAVESWTALRNDFRGVTLYREPVTAKERAFKKRFDQLVADYGEQKVFPRPKERPDRQGRSGSPRPSGAGVAGFDGFLQMAKAFGEIAKAFRRLEQGGPSYGAVRSGDYVGDHVAVAPRVS
jgi:hypothetical protein